MSSIVSAATLRTFAVAGIGAVSMVTGSSPVTAPEWNRASGRRPSSAARSLVVIRSGAQPSEISELGARKSPAAGDVLGPEALAKAVPLVPLLHPRAERLARRPRGPQRDPA